MIGPADPALQGGTILGRGHQNSTLVTVNRQKNCRVYKKSDLSTADGQKLKEVFEDPH